MTRSADAIFLCAYKMNVTKQFAPLIESKHNLHSLLLIYCKKLLQNVLHLNLQNVQQSLI